MFTILVHRLFNGGILKVVNYNFCDEHFKYTQVIKSCLAEDLMQLWPCYHGECSACDLLFCIISKSSDAIC